MPIKTTRLTLRPLAPGDEAFMVALLNDAAFMRFVADRGVRTVDDAREYIIQRAMSPEGFGIYVAELTESGDAIGICTLLKREALDAPDLGFALLAPYRSRGYAFEAAAALKAHAERAMGLKRLLAVVQPDNGASLELLKRLGFRQESAVRLAPNDVELLVYATWQ